MPASARIATPREQLELPYSGLEVVRSSLEIAAGLEAVGHGIKLPGTARRLPKPSRSRPYRHSTTDPTNPKKNMWSWPRGILIAAGIAFVVIAGAVGGGVGVTSRHRQNRRNRPPRRARPRPTDKGPMPRRRQSRPLYPTSASRHRASTISMAYDKIRSTTSCRLTRAIPPESWNLLGTLPARNGRSRPSRTPAVDAIKPGTPLTAASGYPPHQHKYPLVNSIYFLEPNGKVVDRQPPYKEQATRCSLQVSHYPPSPDL